MKQSEKTSTAGLSEEVRGILRCLGCRGPLQNDATALVCPKCNTLYPFTKGVYRFVDMQKYANSFGFQWKLYARTQLDDADSQRSESAFRRRTGFRPEDLAGKLVLDVGCGMGRFAEVATRWGAHIVGIDLSLAAEVAAKNLADRSATIFQSDVFKLPFAPESFDYIYSIGVLHHTPDCEQAFKVLPRYLKPGGSLAVWLYSGYSKWYRFSDIYRRYTSRMSPISLHRALKVAVPIFYHLDRGLRRVPLLGRPIAGAVHHLFPVNRQSDPEARVLDTFDWYSPRYQSKHTYEQVFRWFEDCGMEDLHVGEVAIAIRGKKPAECRTGAGSCNATS